MANLMVVESPNKCKKITEILGKNWQVRASRGHIRDLPGNELGIDSAHAYALTYVFNNTGKRSVDDIAELAKKAEMVYLATDPDREGEAIAWHLKQCLKLTDARCCRVTFDAITPDVVRRAVSSPRRIDMDLVHAQEARRAADRLVGYKVSGPLSALMGIVGMSAGRVQTPAVRIVVDRQLEIESFKPTKHYGVRAEFDGGKWTAEWDTVPHLLKDQKYLLDSALAYTAAQFSEFVVAEASTKPQRKAPPAPFSTSTLLQAASSKLNLKPDQTAALAQKLFEAGLITYHRTDSVNFSAESLTEIRRYAESVNLPIPEKARTWKSMQGAQEAHEAIRPTHIADNNPAIPGEGEEKQQQAALYALIRERALASQLADAVYSVNTLCLTTGTEAQPFVFRASGKTLVEPGWTSLTPDDPTEEQEDADDECGVVPALPVGSVLTATRSHVLNKQTKAPPRYTQASLIKKLEAEGIGRPSTYPAILKHILDKQYVNEIKKNLFATNLGVSLIDSLRSKFNFVELNYTRMLEQQLDDISSGKNQYAAVIAALDSTLSTELSSLSRSSSLTPCPKCKTGFLMLHKDKDFYGCSNYRRDDTGCSFTFFNTMCQVRISDEQRKALLSTGRTELIQGFIGKSGKKFNASLVCNEETGFSVKFEFPPRKN
ncbi:MAG: type I DNA topoisomerase [Acidobacteriaceae bacterium]|nr:type I DNA topoisomerase [Acidobacteriaceae bacterium]